MRKVFVYAVGILIIAFNLAMAQRDTVHNLGAGRDFEKIQGLTFP
jgi:hypothetical protein